MSSGFLMKSCSAGIITVEAKSGRVSDPHGVAANNEADTSGYNALQKESNELISGAKQISQFLDRD